MTQKNKNGFRYIISPWKLVPKPESKIDKIIRITGFDKRKISINLLIFGSMSIIGAMMIYSGNAYGFLLAWPIYFIVLKRRP